MTERPLTHDLDKWMKELGAGITGFQPEAYTVMDAAVKELVKLRKERIVAAAVNHGAVLSLPPPARHHTIIATMDLEMNVDGLNAIPQSQGFLTSTGRFVNRVEGYYIALAAGQLSKEKATPQLFSEDLW